MAKLKKLIKENFSIVGGVVSTPAVNTGYSSLSQIVKEKYGEQTQKVSSKQVSEALKNYNSLGKALYTQQTLKETAKKLSNIAEMAATHTVQETEDWFDKVTVTRNMKELTNHSKQFSKIAEEASSVQQRLSALYEDMGVILNRYYDIPEGAEQIDKDEQDWKNQTFTRKRLSRDSSEGFEDDRGSVNSENSSGHHRLNDVDDVMTLARLQEESKYFTQCRICEKKTRKNALI